jgi:hypothetical protein
MATCIVELPYNAEAIIQSMPGTISSAYNTWQKESNDVGGGIYGAAFATSRSLGTAALVEGIWGYDSYSGEELNGDERFDRRGGTVNIQYFLGATSLKELGVSMGCFCCF